MALPGAEVLMLIPEIVRQIRDLAAMGWGAKRIAAETGVARGTARRYMHGGAVAEVQRRPAAWTLDEADKKLAIELLDGPAQGNGVVVRRLLGERGIPVPLRTLQRALMMHRRERRATEVATVQPVVVEGRPSPRRLGPAHDHRTRSRVWRPSSSRIGARVDVAPLSRRFRDITQVAVGNLSPNRQEG